MKPTRGSKAKERADARYRKNLNQQVHRQQQMIFDPLTITSGDPQLPPDPNSGKADQKPRRTK